MPKPRGGGQPPAFEGEAAERLRQAVAAAPDATLKELAGASGVACSTSTVDRAERLGITRKKKSLRAAEQDRPELKAEREAWRAEFANIDPIRLVFLDESGAATNMTRRHGRARGERIAAAVPHGHWKVVTLTAAVRLGGVGPCLAFDGATDAACFETYVERCLAPSLRASDIVVMDNLSCHKTAEVERLIRSTGGRCVPAGVQPGPQPDRDVPSRLHLKRQVVRHHRRRLRSTSPRCLNWPRGADTT